jgi:hypothetical protein
LPSATSRSIAMPDHHRKLWVERNRRRRSVSYGYVAAKGFAATHRRRAISLKNWRTRHDSNVRPSPSEGDALSN